MRKNESFLYRRCGDLLRLFIENTGSEIALQPDDILVATGLEHDGLIDADIVPDAVYVRCVTPRGLAFLDEMRERAWWRRLLRWLGALVAFLLGAGFDAAKQIAVNWLSP